MNKLLNHKITKVIILCLSLVFIFNILTIFKVEADFFFPSGLSSRTNVWRGLADNLGAVGDPSDEPLKNTSKYNQIGFDITFGVSRDIVTYTGEAYETEEHKRYPYVEKNSSKGKEYWGIDDTDFLKKLDYNAYNNTEDYKHSLRLLALANCNASSGLIDFTTVGGNLLYRATKGLTRITAKVISFLIMAKNIEVSTILEALRLDDLNNLFNKIFIQDENGNITIFLALGLIGFIFAIVGYVRHYATGSSKKSSLRDIFLFLFLGFALIGMSLSGNSVNVAKNGANLVSSLIYAATDTDSNASLFKTEDKLTGTQVVKSQTIAYTETSKLNKALIDAQICMQFGVDDINKLSTQGMNVGGLSDAYTKVTSLNGGSGNLGYYFWAINSPVDMVSVSSDNLKVGNTKGSLKSSATELQMNEFITDLQKLYNNNADSGTRTKLKTMVLNLADPRPATAAAKFIIIFLIFLFLTLALVKLVFKIVLAKVLVGGSILALPIAGPLFISNNKKLIDTAKMLTFTFFSFSIQVLVLSIIFDLVIYVIGMLIGTSDILNLIITLVLVIGLWMWMPKIMALLDELFSKIDSSMSRDLTARKRSIKGAVNRNLSNFNRWNDNRVRTKTVIDEDGKPQTVEVKGGNRFLGALGHRLENDLNTSKSQKTALGMAIAERKINKVNKNNIKLSSMGSSEEYKNIELDAKADSTEAYAALGLSTSNLGSQKESLNEDEIKNLTDEQLALVEDESLRTKLTNARDNLIENESRELVEKQLEHERQILALEKEKMDNIRYRLSSGFYDVSPQEQAELEQWEKDVEQNSTRLKQMYEDKVSREKEIEAIRHNEFNKEIQAYINGVVLGTHVDEYRRALDDKRQELKEKVKLAHKAHNQEAENKYIEELAAIDKKEHMLVEGKIQSIQEDVTITQDDKLLAKGNYNRSAMSPAEVERYNSLKTSTEQSKVRAQTNNHTSSGNQPQGFEVKENNETHASAGQTKVNKSQNEIPFEVGNNINQHINSGAVDIQSQGFNEGFEVKNEGQRITAVNYSNQDNLGTQSAFSPGSQTRVDSRPQDEGGTQNGINHARASDKGKKQSKLNSEESTVQSNVQSYIKSGVSIEDNTLGNEPAHTQPFEVPKSKSKFNFKNRNKSE